MRSPKAGEHESIIQLFWSSGIRLPHVRNELGRAWESFGPDPWLNGEGAYETIIGVQSTGVVRVSWCRFTSYIDFESDGLCQTFYCKQPRTLEVRSVSRCRRPYIARNLLVAILAEHRGKRGENMLHRSWLTTLSVGWCRVRHVRVQSLQSDVFLSQQRFDHKFVEGGGWFQR